MKRLLLVLAMVCLATAVFATDVSFGIGASASYFSSDQKATLGGITGETVLSWVPFNFMAFADMNYLQLSVGYRTFKGIHEKDIPGTEQDFSLASAHYISFAGYLKFPLALGSVKIFPMVGIEYDLVTDGTDASGFPLTSDGKTENNEFWIKGGLGLDFSVGPQLYIRPEAIIGYKLLSKGENDTVNLLKSLGADVSWLDLSFEFALLLGVRL